MTVTTRREVLIGVGATAVASDRAWSREILAPKTDRLAASEWDYCAIKDLVAALRARKISALELADHAIARIEVVDRSVNAVVVRDFERARDAARAADVALSRGETGALLGVPMTVKESFNIAGLPTTWGDPQFRRFMPKEDALVVSRVKNAGAVILGKTNVPLMLSDWQSYNDIYGTTNNPWNLRLTPGGSSGGSAAALACGFGPLSLGSDIGRFVARASALLRRLRAQADTGSCASSRADAAGSPALAARKRSCGRRSDDQKRRRSRACARCDRRSGRGARRHRLPAGFALRPARKPQELPRPRHRHASARSDGKRG